MSNPPLVEVFILCYNRIDFVGESIRSVLDQTYMPIRVVLSDNSPEENVREYLENEFPQLEVRRRAPSQTPYDHLNTVLSEATAPYFMIFHDDDVLEPDYVSKLVDQMERNPMLVCVCANARLLFGSKMSNRLFNPTLSRDMVLSSTEIATRYLDHSVGVNPFPGYLYRRAPIQKLRFDTAEAGLYSDMTFIAKAALLGPILWMAQPLMQYRKHIGNASGVISLKATKRTIRFLVHEKILPENSPVLARFRYWNHLFLLRNSWRSGKGFRKGQLLLVARYFFTHPLPLLRKLLQKLAPY